jgi:hypothetical protein
MNIVEMLPKHDKVWNLKTFPYLRRFEDAMPSVFIQLMSEIKALLIAVGNVDRASAA